MDRGNFQSTNVKLLFALGKIHCCNFPKVCVKVCIEEQRSTAPLPIIRSSKIRSDKSEKNSRPTHTDPSLIHHHNGNNVVERANVSPSRKYSRIAAGTNVIVPASNANVVDEVVRAENFISAGRPSSSLKRVREGNNVIVAPVTHVAHVATQVETGVPGYDVLEPIINTTNSNERREEEMLYYGLNPGAADDIAAFEKSK